MKKHFFFLFLCTDQKLFKNPDPQIPNRVLEYLDFFFVKKPLEVGVYGKKKSGEETKQEVNSLKPQQGLYNYIELNETASEVDLDSISIHVDN